MIDSGLDLPWRTDDPYPDVIKDTFGEEVASVSDVEACAFIVKAVNRDHHFDALVKALEDIDKHLDNFGYPPNMKARKLARQALSAVGSPTGGRT